MPVDGISPDEVEELCTAQWEAHLHQVLPLLAVHDAARTRQPPASWQAVANVVGITRQLAHERWA